MSTVYETKLNEQKTSAVEAVKTKLSENKDYVFTDYRGLTVDQISALRSKLRENNAEYKVIKNRFAKIAFRQMDMPEEIDEFLIGPTALALAKDDAGAVVKALVEFGKDTTLSLKGAVIDGNVFDAKQAEAFSKLPTRDQLLAMLMGTMNAPVRNLMHAMNGVASKLVRTLQAVAEQKKEQG
jgi:large subunit ribosomal protein L10